MLTTIVVYIKRCILKGVLEGVSEGGVYCRQVIVSALVLTTIGTSTRGAHLRIRHFKGTAPGPVCE